MIQVACPSCQASYDVDERRIPASGMRMRCPKCSAAFQVAQDGGTALAPPLAPPAPAVGGGNAGKAPPPPVPGARPRLAPPIPGGSAPADLPAPKASAGASPFGELDLPAPKAVAAASPFGELDLPAPKAASSASPFGEIDLPAPKTSRGGSPFGELDLPAPKAASNASPFGELDLPAPKAASNASPFGELDLPAPKAASNASPFGELDLPAPKAASSASPFGDLDLPAPKAAASASPFGDLDLPALKPAARVPAASPGSDFELDLPAPKAAGGFGDLDLPAPKKPALGGDFEVDLPVARTMGSGFDDLDLPAPKDLELDLPSPKASGPRGAAPKGGGFGDLDLPRVAAPSVDLPRVAAPSVDLPAAKRPSDGLRALGGTGALDLPMAKGFDVDLPRPATTNLDLPAVKGGLELDLPRPATSNVDLPTPKASAGGFGELDLGFGDADELSLPAPRARRASGASGAAPAAFGELDFGDGNGGDELEFGGLSGAESFELPALDEVSPIVRDSMVGESLTVEEKKARAALARKKRAQRVLGATAGILLLGGGVGYGLKFTKHGPFAQYALESFLPAAGSVASASAPIQAAERLAASDTYADVRASLHTLAVARRAEGLNRSLLTRSLVHESLYLVRFGDDPSAAQRASGIASRLAERSYDAPGADLARAATALREGHLTVAANAIAAARAGAGAGDDAYVDLVAGEIALANGQLDRATTAFRAALAHGGGARAQWALARALLRANDPGAAAAVDATLTASPTHVEARTERAKALLRSGDRPAALLAAREAAGLEPVSGQVLKGAPRSRAAALTVVGRVHELDSHRADARFAYAAAARLDGYNLDASLGLGRVLLEEGTAREALVRFEAAIQTESTSLSMFATPGVVRPLVAEARFLAIRALLVLERPQEAQTHVEALLRAFPDDPEIVLASGRVAHAAHREPEAEAAFRRAIELAPSSFAGYLALAQLFFDLDRPGDAGAALASSEGKVQVTAEVRRLEGESELRRNRLPEARAKFLAALELDPADKAAHYGLGVAYRRDRMYVEAAAALDRLGALDPSYPGLALERGQVYEASGQIEQAVLMYRRALGERPDDIDVQVRLGGAQVVSGRLDDARATLSAALAAQPAHATGIYFVGRLEIAAGNLEIGIQRLQDAVRLDAGRAEFHAWLAFAYLEKNELSAAHTEIDRTLALDLHNIDGHVLNARFLLRSGRIDESLAEATVALTADPHRTEVWAVVAECEDRRSRRPQAIAAYRAALAGDPERGEWWADMARVEYNNGDLGGAVQSFERAITIATSRTPPPAWMAEAYRGLGDAALENHDEARARRAFTTYLEVAPPGAPGRSAVQDSLSRL